MAWAVGLRMLALGNMLLYSATLGLETQGTRGRGARRCSVELGLCAAALASDNSLCFQLLDVHHLTRCSLFAPP
jgi:hypothetical protein